MTSDTLEQNSRILPEAFHAFWECSDEMQQVVRESVEVFCDPDSDEDDKKMSLLTMLEALFPQRHDGHTGIDLETSELEDAMVSDESREAIEELNREEMVFAERLSAAMQQKGFTQSKLAGALGIGQPAISMMLARECRPQRRTVQRIAKVLGIKPHELWPDSQD